ncbi:hypothetical protein EJ07DRAFT_157052 [Lizonia empirigonia]|nr:hypothetical protein EJ07DRAFT_157052 [Lizonia empirigonia]
MPLLVAPITYPGSATASTLPTRPQLATSGKPRRAQQRALDISCIKEHGTTPRQWNLPVPSGCLPHIAPELVDLQSGVCTGCLRAHILTQFETRGAVNISCVQTHAAAPARVLIPRDMLATYTASTHNWLPYAHGFLSPDRHEAFYKQLFDLYLHTSATLWDCPSKCGYSAGVLQPNDTPGFPHVECPGCHGRFCANCKRFSTRVKQRSCAKWHGWARDGVPGAMPLGLHLVAGGARGRPSASHVPASSTNPSDISSQDWAHIRHDPSIFFLDRHTKSWARGPCELDALAAQQAGKRFIRQRSHDRAHLWAFIQVDGTHEGGVTLPEILEYLKGNLRPGDALPEITDRMVDVSVANEDAPADADELFGGARAIYSRLAEVLRTLRGPDLHGAALGEGPGPEGVDDDTDDESDSLEGASADGDADVAAVNALFEADAERMQRAMDLHEEARWERSGREYMENHGDELRAALAARPAAEDLDARVARLQQSMVTLLGDIEREARLDRLPEVLGREEHDDRLPEVQESEDHDNNNNTPDLTS